MLTPHLHALLAQLHDNLAAPAAAQLRASTRPLAVQAYMVRQHLPGGGRSASSLQVAPVLPAFMARVQASAPQAPEQAIAAYLAQALQPASAVRMHLSDSGWAPDFTALVHTVQLPAQPTHNAPTDALMVLLCSASLTLPVFHRITTAPNGQRHCTLRSFPSLAQIHALQPLAQSGMLMGAALQ